MATPWQTDQDGGQIGPAMVAILALMLAAATRLPGLDTVPLWTDELISWVLATQETAASLVAAAADQLWPPVHYLVQRATLLAFDPVDGAALWLRLPTAVGGIAAVGLIYWGGRRMVGAWPAALAAMLLALSAAQITLSRDAKGYGLILLLSLLVLGFAHAAVGFHRRQARAGPIAQAGFILICLLALYTHSYVALMLACLFTALALVHGPAERWRLRGAFGRLVAAGTVIALGWAPWLLFGWHGQGHEMVQPPDLERVRRCLTFLAGWLPLAQGVLWAGLALTLAAVALSPTLRRTGWQTGRLSTLMVLLAVAFGPLILAFALSHLLVPMLLEHYLTVSVPAFLLAVCLCLGWGATEVGARLPGGLRGQGAALGTLALTALSFWDLSDRFDPDPVRPVEEWTTAATLVATGPAADQTEVIACTIGLPLFDLPLRQSGWPRGSDSLACHPSQMTQAGLSRLQSARFVWLVSGHTSADPALARGLSQSGFGPPVRQFTGAGVQALLFARPPPQAPPHR